MKKIGYFILNIFHPVFNLFTKQAPEYMRQLREDFKADPYLCGMIEKFNLIHQWIFKSAFNRVKVDQAEIENIKQLSKNANLVYVMKNKGQLEYSFFNYLFLKEEIPLARFSNGVKTTRWKPFKNWFRDMIAKMDYYYQNGLLEDPVDSGYLEKKVTNGQSVLLNLKVSEEFIFGANEDPVNFIPPLIRAAQNSSKPVYLVTQQFLFDKSPDKAKKSWVDLIFGEKSNPKLLRKLILFFTNNRRRSTVKFGQPLNLTELVQKNPNANSLELASQIRDLLISRLQIERKSITGPLVQSPDHFLDKMLRHPDFKREMALIATDSKKEPKDLNNQVQKYFKEIAASMKYSYLEFYSHIIRWMSENIYDGIDVDTQGLAEIKKVAGKYPIVLVPSHKSHIDYLLLSYIFYVYDLTIPHVCAGINLKFWPIDSFIRKGGGFFIRRSFKNNKLYKLVLEHYMKSLIREGHAIEFFIEGTRSRTGKLLKPRFGILSMLMNAYLDNDAEDIYFVPISVHYEKILEEKSYLNEMKGADKEKENVSGLIKATGIFNKKYGKVFVRFAEPVSIKQYFNDKKIDVKKQKGENLKREIQEFAYRMTYDINRVTVVTSMSLVSTSLLSFNQKGISESDILENAQYLRQYLDFKGASLSEVTRHREDWALRKALDKLVDERAIQKHQDYEEVFYTINESKRPVLDYYKNNSLHFFVSLSCFSRILKSSGQESMAFDDLKKMFTNCKTLLRHDFTFSQRVKLEEHLSRIIHFYEENNLVEFDNTTKTIYFAKALNDKSFNLFESLLHTFFETAYFTILFMEHISFEKMDSKKLESLIMEKSKPLYFKGLLKNPEALSQFNIRNALNVFSDLSLIKKDENNMMSQTIDQHSLKKWKEVIKNLIGFQKNKNEKNEVKVQPVITSHDMI